MVDKVALMTKAIQLRKILGEDSSSPIDIFSISKCIDNLTLVFLPMGENLSGMCVKGASSNCVIAINSAMTLGRQRFSLAHELYHMYFDENMFSICMKNTEKGNEIEKAADLFASYFLMPSDEMDNKIKHLIGKNKGGKLSIDDVIWLEQYFGISHMATVIRLKESHYLSSSQVEDFLQTSVKNRAERLGFDSKLYMPLAETELYKTYGLYINQANKLLNHEIISQGKYEELLLQAFRTDLVYGGEDSGEEID